MDAVKNRIALLKKQMEELKGHVENQTISLTVSLWVRYHL